MTIKKLIFNSIFTLAVVLTMVSCHSSKNATATQTDLSGYSLTKGGVAYISTPDEWSTLSCPVKVAIKSPSSMTASARAQMVRGKCIFVSVRMLGFEVATLYADNDTVVVADKFNKRYFATGYSAMREKYNLSINTLQDVLLGRKVNLPNYAGLTIEMTTPSDDSQIMSTLTILPTNADNIYFTFGTPMTVGNNIQMTSTVYVNTKIKNKDTAVSLTWDTNKATFDTDINPTPTNTNGYTQIPLSSITSIIKAQ